MTNENYELKFRDIIPFYGLFSYTKRNWGTGDSEQKAMRKFGLAFYNAIVFTETSFLVGYCLEKLLK